MRTTNRWLPVLTLAGVGSLLVGLSAAVTARSTTYSWFDPLVDVQSIVAREFVDPPDEDKMRDAAISGMLEALNDPYTEFIPARDVREFDKQTRGHFVGIGAEVRMQESGLLIVSPIEDSPAYKGGVMAGDVVTAVDGKPTKGLQVDDCIDMLTGEPNTPVHVTIDRDGQTLEFSLTRARIITPTVKGVHRDGEKWDFWIDPSRKIAYIRLTQFTQGAVSDLKAALDGLVKDGLPQGGLILDLRFNPGGLLQAAVEVSDLFLRDGKIVSTRGRAHPEQTYSARESGTLADFPLVVLVNRQSASASEIVAGALADNNRAIVIGERSFGKGSVQNVIPLPSGAGTLKITEQLYYLPSGRCIHRKDDSTTWGVDPSPGFYVPMTDDEYRAMIEVRRKQEVLRSKAAASDEAHAHWTDAAWAIDHLKDKQLAAAFDAVRLRLEGGAWAATGKESPQGDLSQAELNRLGEARERLLREVSRVDKRAAALASVGADAAKAKPDVIPGDMDLTGGRLAVYDKEGKQVATLKITGADLERWLVDAPVEATTAADAAPAASASPAPPADAAPSGAAPPDAAQPK